MKKSSVSGLIEENFQEEKFKWIGEESFHSSKHKYFYEDYAKKEQTENVFITAAEVAKQKVKERALALYKELEEDFEPIVKETEAPPLIKVTSVHDNDQFFKGYEERFDYIK